MKKLLLVTGSRALADYPASEQWAIQQIERELEQHRPDILLSGGAVGPDTWAYQTARALDIRCVEFKLDGNRYEDGTATRRWCDGPMGPLERNVALVAAAKKAKDSGWDVRVLALRAPWSKTAGTDYTCSKAEAAGLRIVPLSVEMNGPETATKPLLLHELDVIWCDLETGGRVESMHAIVEIGAVRTDPSHRHVLDKFELKLWPADGFVVDHGASLINGFSNARWSANNAFEAREGLDKFLKWLPERFRFANYNANFDVRFLKYHAKVHGLPSMGIVGDLIDPLFTVRKTLKKTGVLPNAKLDTICEYYGIRSNDAHQALADAERARLVYLALLGKESTGEAVELTR